MIKCSKKACGLVICRVFVLQMNVDFMHKALSETLKSLKASLYTAGLSLLCACSEFCVKR